MGVALVYSVAEYPSLLLAGAVFGLGMGGIIPLWGVTIGAGFGRNAFVTFLGVYALAMIATLFLRLPEVEPGGALESEHVAAGSPATAPDGCSGP